MRRLRRQRRDRGSGPAARPLRRGRYLSVETFEGTASALSSGSARTAGQLARAGGPTSPRAACPWLRGRDSPRGRPPRKKAARGQNKKGPREKGRGPPRKRKRAPPPPGPAGPPHRRGEERKPGGGRSAADGATARSSRAHRGLCDVVVGEPTISSRATSRVCARSRAPGSRSTRLDERTWLVSGLAGSLERARRSVVVTTDAGNCTVPGSQQTRLKTWPCCHPDDDRFDEQSQAGSSPSRRSAFDNGVVTSTGASILDLFGAEKRPGHFGKWGPGHGKEFRCGGGGGGGGGRHAQSASWRRLAQVDPPRLRRCFHWIMSGQSDTSRARGHELLRAPGRRVARRGHPLAGSAGATSSSCATR